MRSVAAAGRLDNAALAGALVLRLGDDREVGLGLCPSELPHRRVVGSGRLLRHSTISTTTKEECKRGQQKEGKRKEGIGRMEKKEIDIFKKGRRGTLASLLASPRDTSVAYFILKKKNQNKTGSDGPRLCDASYKALIRATAE